MLDYRVLISCGNEVETFRDLAKEGIQRLAQMFVDELNTNVVIREWDFRLDNPRVVPAGEFAQRSLAMARRAGVVIGILGNEIPGVTKEELIDFAERRSVGEDVEIYLFVNPDLKTEEHDDLVEEIRHAFGLQLIWAPYRTEAQFVAGLFTTLFSDCARRRLGMTPAPEHTVVS